MTGGEALGEAAEDEHDPGVSMRAGQLRATEGVQDPAASLAPIVADRGAEATVDAEVVGELAGRAGQPGGVEQAEDLLVAGVQSMKSAIGKSMAASPWDRRCPTESVIQLSGRPESPPSPNPPHKQLKLALQCTQTMK
jgi:hypothetical protein